jgi:hypothetical protein
MREQYRAIWNEREDENINCPLVLRLLQAITVFDIFLFQNQALNMYYA